MLRFEPGCKLVLLAFLTLVPGAVPALSGRQTVARSAPSAASQQKPASSQQTINQIGTTYDLLYGLGAAPSALDPSPFVVESVRQRKPGTALDIGSGNGRNSLYLAQRGWTVTAVDLSRVGLDQTRLTAEHLGVQVRTVAGDINRFDFGHNRWDLVLLIDFPFAYRQLLPRIREGLRPGGWLLIEAVSEREWKEMKKTHDPHGKLPYTFMRRTDLDHAFAGFRVLHDESEFLPTPWGGHAWMIRYLAQKPYDSAARP